MWATLLFKIVSPVSEFTRYSGSRHSGFARRNAVPYNCLNVAGIGGRCSARYDGSFLAAAP